MTMNPDPWGTGAGTPGTSLSPWSQPGAATVPVTYPDASSWAQGFRARYGREPTRMDYDQAVAAGRIANQRVQLAPASVVMQPSATQPAYGAGATAVPGHQPQPRLAWVGLVLSLLGLLSVFLPVVTISLFGFASQSFGFFAEQVNSPGTPLLIVFLIGAAASIIWAIRPATWSRWLAAVAMLAAGALSCVTSYRAFSVFDQIDNGLGSLGSFGSIEMGSIAKQLRQSLIKPGSGLYLLTIVGVLMLALAIVLAVLAVRSLTAERAASAGPAPAAAGYAPVAGATAWTTPSAAYGQQQTYQPPQQPGYGSQPQNPWGQ